MTHTNDLTTAHLVTERWDQGETAGKLDLTPGNLFRGAYGAATDANLARTSLAHSSFVHGYLSVMPKAVDLDEQGRTLAPGTGELQIFGAALSEPAIALEAFEDNDEAESNTADFSCESCGFHYGSRSELAFHNAAAHADSALDDLEDDPNEPWNMPDVNSPEELGYEFGISCDANARPQSNPAKAPNHDHS